MAPDADNLDPSNWVDRFGDYLFSFAMARLRNEGLAEDAVQETLLAAIKARDNFAGGSTVKTWLTSILKRKVVDQLRRLFRDGPELDLENMPYPDRNNFQQGGQWRGHWNIDPSTMDWGSDPSAFLEKEEFWKVFNNCLSKLPSKLAVTFTMYQVDEMTADEVCKELQITPTNLWVMLHRSRRQLRHCLERNWVNDEGNSAEE